jgi:glycosyltransferase involved in cell wall biosynthesis
VRSRLDSLYKFFLANRHERTLFRKYNACVVVAERDADVIRKLCPKLDVRVFPNGTELDYFRPDPNSTVLSHRLIFTGTMDFAPNIDAVLWFCREIFPLIQRQHSEVTLEIVGRNPTAEISALTQNTSILVTGFVPDLRPQLAQAALYVCPLRHGSGIKNKVLEAMAMGKAIVTTSEGCSGIGGKHGHEYLVADNPNEFATAVTSLLGNCRQRQQLAESARCFVEQRFSWERTAEQLHRLFLNVSQKKDHSV